MKHLLISSISQIKKYLKSTRENEVKLEITTHKEKYKFIRSVLIRLKYNNLPNKDKIIVWNFIKFFTDYSVSHIKRLIRKWRNGTLHYSATRKRSCFPLKYFPIDIALLIETDIAHECLSGQATRKILQREYLVFKKDNYKTISEISASHIYNTRNNNLQYGSSKAMTFKRTKAIQVNIGIRKKPKPNGAPGYVRVDTVHQGDFKGQKGVYHINIVDEVTQYEIIATVEKISEQFLRPVIEEMLKLFPFVVYEFHVDNGSEYINKVVVKLLNKIHIELTKSRSRHSNDNALVESKNGSIIRKFYGRNYIDQKRAKLINEFNKKYLNIYLNYHRPSAFSTDTIDAKGKIKKKYTHWIIPYEKFKSLKNAKQYLKPNFSFEELDKIAYEKSDNEFAKEMQKEKIKLFKIVSKE